MALPDPPSRRTLNRSNTTPSRPGPYQRTGSGHSLTALNPDDGPLGPPTQGSGPASEASSPPEISAPHSRPPTRRTVSNTSVVAAAVHPLGPKQAPAHLPYPASGDNAPPPPLPRRPPPAAQRQTPSSPPNPTSSPWDSPSLQPADGQAQFRHPELAALYHASLQRHAVLAAHPDEWQAILEDVDKFLVGFVRRASRALEANAQDDRKPVGARTADPGTPNSSLELDAAIVADHYQQFVQDIHMALTQGYYVLVESAQVDPPSPDPATVIMGWLAEVEDQCTALLYPHAFCPRYHFASCDDHLQDEATASRIAALHLADFQLSHLGLDLAAHPLNDPAYRFRGKALTADDDDQRLLSFTDFVEEAVRQTAHCLQAMDEQTSVIKKMDSVVAALHLLTKAAQTHPEMTPSDVTPPPADSLTDALPNPLATLSADDLLPLMIYTVVRYNPPRLVSNLRYLQRYLYRERQSRGIPAYCLTTLAAAASFVETVDFAALGLGAHHLVTSPALDANLEFNAADHSLPISAVGVARFSGALVPPAETGSTPLDPQDRADQALLSKVVVGALHAVQRGLPMAWSHALGTLSMDAAPASGASRTTPPTAGFTLSPERKPSLTAKELMPLPAALDSSSATAPAPDSATMPSSSPSWLPMGFSPYSLLPSSRRSQGQAPTSSTSPPSEVGSAVAPPGSVERADKDGLDLAGGGIKVISGMYGMVYNRFLGSAPDAAAAKPPGPAHPLPPTTSASLQAKMHRRQTDPYGSQRGPGPTGSAMMPARRSDDKPRPSPVGRASVSGHLPSTTSLVRSGSSTFNRPRNPTVDASDAIAKVLNDLPPLHPKFTACQLHDVPVTQVDELLAEYQKLALAVQRLQAASRSLPH
ncbi:hypothetical protein H4R35_001426 [Dimargaris xerosporica]|nr:hypothetical protein H4R35_001426 [Dimargaris xerosporica]